MAPYSRRYAQTYHVPAIRAPLEERLAFVRNTYLVLGGSILAFAALSFIFVVAGIGEALLSAMGGQWLLMIGALMLVAVVSNVLAAPERSFGLQVLGLGLYVTGEALFFSPVFTLIGTVPRFEGILGPAVTLSSLIFTGLTLYVLITRQDFSFLRGALVVCGCAAFGLIVASFLFSSISLGMWFSVAMIVLACGFILYETSQVLERYSTDQTVGAALSLFASVMLLFWYVLRLFMELRR